MSVTSPSPTASIRCEVADQIAVITLNRPDRLNAWNAEMEAGLRAALERCRDDREVRVIVLTGAGKAFCAGADLSAARARLTASGPQCAVGTAAPMPDDATAREDFDQRYSYLLAIGKPIICALNGAAAGVGLVLALYCDIRYASHDARLVPAFVRRGLAAEHGIAWILPRLIGLSRALEWLISGRSMSAQEADQAGLVSAVLEADGFLPAVLERAATLATLCSPSAMAAAKRQSYLALGQTLGESVALAEREIAASLQGSDFREGVAAFLDKRQPSFLGLGR
ncbi:enoyl-CoA hydratase PaaG (plasmid) [Cupriavidus necator N-1]|uniref:Enoyl-CoA hydratase PaaG n=1 Tax=Cupriavidus necator (strain ATCC 43291 / DSM 13513 / CCUG 52238 / LMG 8453 / N-1) TaxID=1042878 RepID=F8GVV5_CUPNN|nr:enoyl-CoA hydratase-related protein [Cupriavidus necator]AEI81597.1 enoyl-CoA hydratase PaaG [Cupriavidus necator N-1]MDX6007965.1 enoyl-CoA hydratase-related protein [Cupriavidus necator]